MTDILERFTRSPDAEFPDIAKDSSLLLFQRGMKMSKNHSGLLGLFFVAGMFLSPRSAEALPSEVILLRHAEKATSTKLCDMGQRRAAALAAQYLGKGGANSLFGSVKEPAAFLAITLHTIETISPAAQTWGLPVTVYSVAPSKNDDGDEEEKDELLARRTQEAAKDILMKPEFDRKVVVISWEHKHIASKKLDQDTTLRHLLGLDRAKGVPILGLARTMTFSGSSITHPGIRRLSPSAQSSRFLPHLSTICL